MLLVLILIPIPGYSATGVVNIPEVMGCTLVHDPLTNTTNSTLIMIPILILILISINTITIIL